MPADALNYFYLANELNSMLSGGRIDKITMPEPDEIVLNIRAGGTNHNLLISASANMPRIHITKHNLPNPSIAPAFLMHLRKHISGAGIISVTLMPYERVIQINLRSKNELGYSENKTLIAEIMGKYSNIILVNDKGIISESIKHVTIDTSSKRQVLSGLEYCNPPSQNKLTPQEEVKIKTELQAFNGGRIDNFLMQKICGLAPATISETVYNAIGTLNAQTLSNLQIDSITQNLSALYNLETKACVFSYVSGKCDFAFTPFYYNTQDVVFYNSLNEAMEEFYFKTDKAKRLNEKAHTLISVVKNAIARTEKKLKLFYERKLESEDLEQDRLYGELITANIYKIKQGMKSIEVENYYTALCEKTIIRLDENKTPQFNAQKYFKKYSKKKKTLENLAEQILSAEDDLDYYNSIVESFRQFDTIAEMDEIATEMANAGLITIATPKKGAPKKTIATPPAKINFNGYTIIYGRNNIQNDRITKNAKPTDIWFHARLIHGAHVIIENNSSEFPPDDIIQQAAELAATYSKAFESDNVPVDYTFAKYVSKPKGAPLGKVIYTNQRTIYVSPKR